jgi:aminoglycoside 2'-N-acetyltransferase I
MTGMAEVRIAHTADLDAVSRRAARAFLDDVFEDMTDHDSEHALGGMHALVSEEAELIGHASLIQRRLLHGGRALRTGYVEASRSARTGADAGTARPMGALKRFAF